MAPVKISKMRFAKNSVVRMQKITVRRIAEN
jgi:hypothetical protein